MLRLKQIIRSEEHNVFTKKVNEIAFNANDDKRIIPVGVTTYPYGYGC